jgi:hypothetical protein
MPSESATGRERSTTTVSSTSRISFVRRANRRRKVASRAARAVAGHGLERPIGGWLRQLCRPRDVLVGSGREDVAEVQRAFLAPPVEQLQEQLLLVGEVVVDGAAAEAGLVGHRLEAGGVEAASREHAGGCRKNLLARMARRSA